MKWETVQLGDCVKFRSGGTPSKSNPGFWSGDIPWVSSGEMDLSRIYDTKLHVTEEAVEAGSRMVSAGAILAVVRGMSLAKDFRVARVMRDVAFNQDLKAIDPDATLDSNYLYWALSSKRNFIRDHATEASHGTKKLELDVLESLAIPRPPLPTQRRIAEILSAYDDLIENNQRRMKLLEESARLLYEEWFVRLRFPGHEHTKIVDGVPEGWSRRKLGELCSKIGSGATPRGGEAAYRADGITLIRSQNVYDDRFMDDGLAKISEEQAKLLESVSVCSKDILLNITGASVARCCIAPDRHLPARVNQHVMIIRVREELCSPFFVHAAINSDSNKRQLLAIARAGGATREALTKDDVASFEILAPDATVTSEFHAISSSSFEMHEKLEETNKQLRVARDLLLPRLMNGEIEV